MPGSLVGGLVVYREEAVIAKSPVFLPLRIWVRFAASRLDARLAWGEEPAGDPALERRSQQLVSLRVRRTLARGFARVCSERRQQVSFSAAVPCDWRAVELARPALQQLAAALRSRKVVHPRGVALAQVLLTDPCSALYQPTYTVELYEVAREALFALGRDKPVTIGSGGPSQSTVNVGAIARTPDPKR